MAEVSAKVVMDLRGRTGCGMMDCKKALAACDGDIEKAIDYLREKGLAKAAKKQSRIAAEGVVDSYIHMGGKVGVLVLAEGEKNDTVAEVLHDVALQIAAASPVAPEYVTREEVNPEHLQHETEILAAQARNEGKPEKIIEKMVQGRINKFYEEVCLVEQIFVKDGETKVGKMIETKAPGTKVVAFTRYKMGDGIEKKVTDLAAEVAAQTQMK